MAEPSHPLAVFLPSNAQPFGGTVKLSSGKTALNCFFCVRQVEGGEASREATDQRAARNHAGLSPAVQAKGNAQSIF
jgi:hypothetical protein